MYARDTSRQYVNNYTLGGGAFASIPIPGTSILLTAAEAKMIHGIGAIYGLELKGAAGGIIIKIIMGTVGGSLLLKSLSEALSFVPILGWLAKPAVAAAAIKSFGEATIAYFEHKFPNKIANIAPTLEDMLIAFGETIAADYFNEIN